MGIRASRPHNDTTKQFTKMANAIARSYGWKDHADALAHRDENGKVGYNILGNPEWDSCKHIDCEGINIMAHYIIAQSAK